MIRLADLPIRFKLALATAISSGLALLLASVSFVVFDRTSFEEAMVRRLRTVAEIVAWNGAPAVVFRDPDSAGITLSGLRSEPAVVSAVLYDSERRVFAHYSRGGAPGAAPSPLPEASGEGGPSQAFEGDELRVVQPILFDGERVGTLVILSGLRERSERGLRYGAIAAAVFGTSLLVALLVGWVAQRTLSEPLGELAEAARRMSRHEGLGTRPRPRGRDELGELVEAFNVMVDGLQRRDDDLRRAHAELERRIHEREELYRKADQANRLKDEFLATLSHELRTPLTAIVGWASVLLHGADAATARKAAETISRNAQTQSQLIADILDMQRITSGKLRLQLRELPLAPLVEAAVDTVRPAAAAKAIAIETAIDDASPRVMADAGRLQQVVWNLLSNAVKFTPRGGSVRVGLPRPDGEARITIEDDGPGLDPGFIPYAFDRFRQADSSTTRHHGGLGLGLAIVKTLVELHGGSVSVRNRSEGTGAIFTVVLPAAEKAPPPGSAWELERTGAAAGEQVVRPAAPPSLSGVRVLVVEDEADARELVAAVLQRCGADVTAVPSAREALERVRRERPDVLVSDVAMPGEDGISLMRRVRQLLPEEGGLTPAVALTALARDEDRGRALAAGFQIHVSKPVQPDELAAVVASLAGRGHRRTEAP
jgi:signal transduction histidine kinase/ActR/RegA family two-component response regulator